MGIINIFNGRSRQNRAAKTKEPKKKKSGKFSQAEKQAYAAGQSYALAKAGERVQLRSKKQEESFRKGMQSVSKPKELTGGKD